MTLDKMAQEVAELTGKVDTLSDLLQICFEKVKSITEEQYLISPEKLLLLQEIRKILVPEKGLIDTESAVRLLDIVLGGMC
jgi:hypothetical protein